MIGSDALDGRSQFRLYYCRYRHRVHPLHEVCGGVEKRRKPSTFRQGHLVDHDLGIVFDHDGQRFGKGFVRVIIDMDRHVQAARYVA